MGCEARKINDPPSGRSGLLGWGIVVSNSPLKQSFPTNQSMSEEGIKVEVYLYDLSQGMAKAMSMALVGTN